MLWLCLALLIKVATDLIFEDEDTSTTDENESTKAIQTQNVNEYSHNSLACSFAFDSKANSAAKSYQSKSVYPNNSLRAFRSFEERMSHPGKTENDYLLEHPAGYQSSNVNVMTTSQYLAIHPEHADRVSGSYFDRMANPQNYI